MLVEDHVIQKAICSLSAAKVPAVLQNRILQHQQHLMDLANALLNSGQSKESVRQAIEIVMDSFKQELTVTIAALMEKHHA